MSIFHVRLRGRHLILYTPVVNNESKHLRPRAERSIDSFKKIRVLAAAILSYGYVTSADIASAQSLGRELIQEQIIDHSPSAIKAPEVSPGFYNCTLDATLKEQAVEQFKNLIDFLKAVDIPGKEEEIQKEIAELEDQIKYFQSDEAITMESLVSLAKSKITKGTGEIVQEEFVVAVIELRPGMPMYVFIKLEAWPDPRFTKSSKKQQ